MSLDRAPRAVALFESFDSRLQTAAKALKSRLPGVGDDDLEVLVSSLGGPDKVEALARAMPDQPGIDDLIIAMGGAKKLGTFAAKTLGGNVAALAVLADKGCGRDAAALADIADKFADEPETLENMLSEGGLGDHPEALAQVFARGCDGDADKLLSFCRTFDSETRRGQLRDVLDEGGLGQAPVALGSLAAEGNGALLLDVAQKADRAALGDMLASGGMGGQPPDHPDTLKAVLKDALGNDPERLKDLHDAFPHGPGGMSELQDFLSALNGGSLGGEAMAGKRMGALMQAFKRRGGMPQLTPAQQAQHLYDPYFVEVTRASGDARAPDESGAGVIDRAAGVIAQRADPPGGRIAGGIMDALPKGAAVELLAQLTADPQGREQLAGTLERLELARAGDAALRSDTGDRAPDGDLSGATGAAIRAADELRAALDNIPGGGTPGDVDGLTRAALACQAAARDEPGGALRGEALDCAKRAMAAAQAALDRQAGLKLATLAGAGDQRLALAATGDMAARIRDDANASAAEKAAMQAAADAAGQALGAVALAGRAGDTGALASKVGDGVAGRLGKDPADPAVTEELARLKQVAEVAAKAANSLVKALKGAPPPVDPALLTQAGMAAQGAVQAGLATADEAAMKAAIEAGKALSVAVAVAARGVAASAETSLAFASDKARPAVLALGDIDAIRAALLRDKGEATGPDATLDARLDGLRGAAEEATRSALAAAELDRIASQDAEALARGGEQQAARQAALDGIGLDEAREGANDLARRAAQAAQAAADALSGLPPPIDQTLIKTATGAAQAAAMAAPGATDKALRDNAVTEGRRAATAAAAALGENAVHMLAERTAARKVKARASTGAAKGQADTFAGDFNLGRPALASALKDALGDIGEAAASQLSQLAAADDTVRDARAGAATAAAAAGRPGAGGLRKLLSIRADSEAQAALARLAVDRAGAAVTALASAAVPVWPPTLTNAPPPPHYVRSASPVAPTETQLRDATILCEAAITACTKWVSQATRYRNASGEFLRLAENTPEPVRSAEEKDDLARIAAMASIADDKAGAPGQLNDARDALAGMNTVTGELEEKAQLLMHAMQIARIDFKPPGNGFDIADTTTDPGDPALESAAGFAAIIGTRAFKTVKIPGGGTATTCPSDRESLMATGANLTKDALPADFADPAAPAPPPPPPRIPLSGNAPITGHADCVLDIQHMSERHCRSHFTFDPRELKAEEDILACAMLKARITGLDRNVAANGAAAALFSADENKVKRIGSGKTTSMWPEGTTPDDIAAAATLALVQLKSDNTGGDPFAKFVFDRDSKHQYSRVVNAIRVGRHTLDVALGVSSRLVTGPVKVVMFYPIGEESLTVADCNKLKSALGI